MDVSVRLSSLLPMSIIVKGAKDEQHALRIALNYCWVRYPGIFYEDNLREDSYPYRNKCLELNYPTMEVISWQ